MVFLIIYFTIKTYKFKILLFLKYSGSKVRLTIWGDQVSNYINGIGKKNPKGLIIVITSVNPKLYSGKLN